MMGERATAIPEDQSVMPSIIEVARALAGSDDTGFVLSRDLTLVRTNPAWTRFATANGGTEMLDRYGRGSSVLQAIPAILRPFYEQGYARALATKERWEHDYECSSPDRYRRFRMLVYPIDSQFLAVVNASIIDVAHDREPSPADAARYTTDGVIAMCSHCRRVRNPAGVRRWDWVPRFVALQPPNLSHGLCDACTPIYFPP